VKAEGAGRPAPYLTLLLVVVSLGLVFWEDAAASLDFQRERLASQPWRFLTGHLVHGHALALVDLLVLGALGGWWEQRSRMTYGAILVTSGVLASLALVLFTSYRSYSGSSALSAGLFAAAALELVLAGRGGLRWLGAAALALFVAKCALEALAPSRAFFAALPGDTEVAASAHAAGGLGGALAVLLRRPLERRLRRKDPVAAE